MDRREAKAIKALPEGPEKEARLAAYNERVEKAGDK